MQYLERVFRKVRDAYQNHRFVTTEILLHPATHLEVERELHEDGRLPHRAQDGRLQVSTPAGVITLTQTETVPPYSLQLRRAEPREGARLLMDRTRGIDR